MTQIVTNLGTAGIIYRGTFALETAYYKQNCVTHDGSLWICIADTGSTGNIPSAGSAYWAEAASVGSNAPDYWYLRTFA